MYLSAYEDKYVVEFKRPGSQKWLLETWFHTSDFPDEDPIMKAHSLMKAYQEINPTYRYRIIRQKTDLIHGSF